MERAIGAGQVWQFRSLQMSFMVWCLSKGFGGLPILVRLGQRQMLQQIVIMLVWPRVAPQMFQLLVETETIMVAEFMSIQMRV